MSLITRDEILMGRDTEFPLSTELEHNLQQLLTAINHFRSIYGKPMVVSSGYRPGYYNRNVGGANNSSHITCEACDFHDVGGDLDYFCVMNQAVLEQCGLYLESPARTINWCHLTIRPPHSGKRVFLP